MNECASISAASSSEAMQPDSTCLPPLAKTGRTTKFRFDHPALAASAFSLSQQHGRLESKSQRPRAWEHGAFFLAGRGVNMS